MKKIITFLFSLIIAIILMIGILGYLKYYFAIQELPLSQAYEQITTSSDYVPYEEISPDLIKATVAIEDHRFFERKGFDFIAFFRATYHNLIAKEIVQGGSTITQQVAKNMYFNNKTSFIRKVAEVFLLYDLEANYTKNEIIALYVNIIYYGDGHMGIKSASNGYFNVEPKDLTLAQATLLAGLPQAPSIYQLSTGADKAYARQKQVLNAMLEQKLITQEQVEECLK